MDSLVLERTIARPAAPNIAVPKGIAQRTAAERLALALRRHVGRGQSLSTSDVAAALGVSVSYIEKAMRGEYTFGLATMLALQALLPPQFTNDILELARLTGARRLAGEERAAGIILAELCDEAAAIARDLADGKLDHREKAELRKTLPKLIEHLQEFQAQLGKANG